MENVFNKLELDVATEILNIGLAKAADSLSFFTKEKVFINGMNIKFTTLENANFLYKQGENITLLSTKLEGELSGYSYLIFNESEVNTLAKMSLPEEIINNPDQFAEMKNAILLEVDNIITGAVVTQFSNLLCSDMHGLVPSSYSGNQEEVEDYIRNQSINEKYILQCNTSLGSENNNLNPEFLWCLNFSFLDAIKAFIRKNNNLTNLVDLI